MGLVGWAFIGSAAIGTLCSMTAVDAEVRVGPYVQQVTASSAWILWETSGEAQSLVEWGITPELGNSTVGHSKVGFKGTRIHEVNLKDLEPERTVFYRSFGSKQTFHFKTTSNDLKPFRFVVYSDNQDNPSKHKEIVNQGILSYLEKLGKPLVDSVKFVMVTGDIVSIGSRYSDYKERFFDPIQNLSAYIPYYTTIGNHEEDSPFYFNYLHLPENGTKSYLEHWYSFNYSNAHFVGLDSNYKYNLQVQLDWLENDLTEHCKKPNIDFFFLFFHHPAKSELWPDGESKYSRAIQAILDKYLLKCQKIGAHFFGHAHGYSRGQSRDVSSLWVNAATASGSIDHWGDNEHTDYEVYQRSFAEYGFLVAEVKPGLDSSLRLIRISLGDEKVSLNNVVRDHVFLKMRNKEPQRPVVLSFTSGKGLVTLISSRYFEEEGDFHLESHWQISEKKGDFSTPVLDRWERFENWFYDEDTQKNSDLTTVKWKNSTSGKVYFARVRYRDSSLGWSEWSSEFSFSPSY